jgi:hypothetical protein
MEVLLVTGFGSNGLVQRTKACLRIYYHPHSWNNVLQYQKGLWPAIMVKTQYKQLPRQLFSSRRDFAVQRSGRADNRALGAGLKR